MELLDFIFRIFVSFILGVAIGVERQWRQRSAGLRTNTLVSLGAATYMLISVSLTNEVGDPSRIASQIVTGIGFLGAGVIMKDGFSVQGLNTAATIWCSAAVGSLCALGEFFYASIVTAFVMLTHVVLRPIGHQLNSRSFFKRTNTQFDYLITICCKIEVENYIRVQLMQLLGKDDKLLLKSLTSDDTNDPTSVTITAQITALSQQDNQVERVASRLTIENKITKVSWEIIGTQVDG